MGQDIKEVCAEYLFMQQCLCQCVPEWLWITPTTYGRDSAYCLKSRGGVRGIYASLWRFLLRCALFCRSDATFLTSVSSYEGGCGFEDILFSYYIAYFLFIFSIYSFIDLRQNKIHGKWRLHVEEPPFLININNYYFQSIFLKYILSPLWKLT